MSEEDTSRRRSRRAASYKGKYSEMVDEDEMRYDNSDDASIEMNDSSSEDDPPIDDLENSPSQSTKRKGRASNGATRSASQTPRKRGRPRAVPVGTPSRLDASARKKATRTLLRIRDGSGDELDAEDARIAEQIIRESMGQAQVEGRIDEFGDDEMAGSLFLDGPEGYFDQHKQRSHGSSTPFSRAPLIEYEQFVRYIQEHKGIHAHPRAFVASLYRTMFSQWSFELSQGFNLLFYGVGSKRDLVMEFVEQALDLTTLVVNGYNPATTLKEILNSSVSALVPDERTRKAFPKTPTELVNALVRHMDTARAEKQKDQKQVIDLCVVIHNLDGEALRGEKSQALLARLAAIPEVMMIATVDHINAPVLWDAAKLSQYNFLWHDLTTFDQYTTETAYDDPLALGRNRSTVGTKGAKYVLASLTANARALFQLLAAQQLEVMTEDTSAGGALGTIHHGVEFKLFYKRCVEQFIVSNELNFRTMLGEFVEHKMVIITKDQTGIETIYIPFTKEALEQAIEDIADM